MGVIILERNEMAKEIVFTFTPDKQDYIDASRTLALKTSSFIVVGALILLVVIASIVVLLFPFIGDPSWRSAAYVGIAMGVFYIVNFWLIIPYQLSNAYKRNERLRQERTLRVGETGLSLQIGERSTDFSWEHFQKVLERNGFFLMIYKAEELIYPFLPDRAFHGETSRADFLAFLAEKHIPIK